MCPSLAVDHWWTGDRVFFFKTNENSLISLLLKFIVIPGAITNYLDFWIGRKINVGLKLYSSRAIPKCTSHSLHSITDVELRRCNQYGVGRWGKHGHLDLDTGFVFLFHEPTWLDCVTLVKVGMVEA